MTDEQYNAIMARLDSIEERLPPAVASMAQINGEYGNPKINFDPKQWKGASYKGKTAKDCTAEFLETYAETLEYMASHPKKDADPKYIGYNRKDAKLCRRWALVKGGNTMQAITDAVKHSVMNPEPEQDEIPF